MNSVDIWALWLLGFKRREPKTRLGRYARTSKRTLTVIALIYLTLLAFPQVLFAHSGSAGGATSYSRSPLPPETSTRISEITDRISPSELAVAGRSERTFLCNSAALFRGFAPLNADAFA
ncbi:MAG TPA: hypothetical protein VK993_03380, partial [Chthoniobacterales bacterium]|nr:hypothetical protein [Chthoniobacterales bacterium]